LVSFSFIGFSYLTIQLLAYHLFHVLSSRLILRGFSPETFFINSSRDLYFGSIFIKSDHSFTKLAFEKGRKTLSSELTIFIKIPFLNLLNIYLKVANTGSISSEFCGG